MILPRYRVAASTLPGAGKGLFADEAIAKGRVIIAPDNVHTVWPEAKLRGYAADSIEVESSVRWFETQFSLTPEWSDECYVNHSFTPNALWHLGFIFALRDIAAGEELLMDYQHVIGSGEVMPFVDAATGKTIVGLTWAEAMQRSLNEMATFFPADRGINLNYRAGVSMGETVIEVRNTNSSRGLGVYANRAIACGEMLEKCSVIVINCEIQAMPHDIKTRVYDAGCLLSRSDLYYLPLGCGSFYNHSVAANVLYEVNVSEQSISYIAARAISQNEELLINYNGNNSNSNEGEGDWFKRMGVTNIG